ncbi:peptide deformylase [Nocardia altamirensis]|uniref:peptide deformylase n=1 Tax=Nocardia altamirensis TaxID=472158 RepID=UPI0008400277|nr:peptide deformylase [Nocardia altamirensis]
MTTPDTNQASTRGSYHAITEVGNPVLHQRCRDVTEFGTEALARLVDDMFHTMYVARGVGLAANQIGVDLQVFVYDCPDDYDTAEDESRRNVGHICNPVLENVTTEPQIVGREGCLSVPGPVAQLARAAHTIVRGKDMHGNDVTLEGTGLFARCLQHETDHLAGTLYIDHLTDAERADVLAEMAQNRDAVLADREERAQAC